MLRACRKLSRRQMLIYLGASLKPSHVAGWLIRVFSVADNRESEAEGIGGNMERLFADAFRLTGHSRR